MTRPEPLRSPGLQTVPTLARPSAAAAALADDVLVGELTVDEAVEAVAVYFRGLPRVDTVVAALTTFAPNDPAGWRHLGDRAWVREWRDPGSPCQVIPAGATGAEAALTMPWMSQFARSGVVVIPDSEQLPPAADQDRLEMAVCGARAIIASAQFSGASLYGSVSIGSAEAGPWPETLVADMRLLGAALTSRMAAEQAHRSQAEAMVVGDQARSQQQQFFATVGHELRTPIAAIVGFAEMLTDEARDRQDGPTADSAFAATVEHDSGVILRAGEQLLAIVEDLLSTGRVLGEEQAREDLDPTAAVEDVIHWHRTPAAANGVTLTSTVPPGLTVHARPSGVRQVLANLVGNAVIHNRAGGSVEISAEPSLDEGRQRRVRIMVRDTGPGLTAEELADVFDPFVRFADAAVKGTGLGLSLARAVAERDGGVVGAESTPGQGSVFWVDLPAG